MTLKSYDERLRDRAQRRVQVTAPLGVFLFAILIVLTSIAAMITHIFICIKTSAWVLLAFGLLFAPVGVIHGIGSWLGLL